MIYKHGGFSPSGQVFVAVGDTHIGLLCCRFSDRYCTDRCISCQGPEVTEKDEDGKESIAVQYCEGTLFFESFTDERQHNEHEEENNPTESQQETV